MTTRTRMVSFRSLMQYTPEKAPACGRQVEVISPGYAMLGGRSCRTGCLKVACCRNGFFSPGSKIGWHGFAISRVSDSAS
jgi:hypothetical protein